MRNTCKLYHIILDPTLKRNMSGRVMSGRTNVRRATVRSGYCLIGLRSCWVTVSRATIPRDNVRSGSCPSG